MMGREVPTALSSGLRTRRCTRISDGDQVQWTVGLPSAGDGDQATGASVAAEALALLHLELPQVATSPPRDALQVVAIPVWFWIENFEPVSVTATVDDIAATLWATPITTRVDTGEDGLVVTCDGPGTPYDVDVDPRSQSSDCSHAFDRHGDFTVGVTVTWLLHWEATSGEAGSLPSVDRTTTYEISITELQAVTH